MSRVRYPRSMGMTVAARRRPGTRGSRSRVGGHAVRGRRRVGVARGGRRPRTRSRVAAHPAGLRATRRRRRSRARRAQPRAPRTARRRHVDLVNTADRAARREGRLCVVPAAHHRSRRRLRPPRTPARHGGGCRRSSRSASQQLLFRDVRSFAVGHGCAVTWDGTEPDTVATTFLPRHELLLSEAAGGDDLDLSMTALADDDSFDVLERLIDRLPRWIDGLASSVAEPLDDEEEATLQLHMRRGARGRRPDGRRYRAAARPTPTSARAFQLTNLAMAQQRSRQEHHRGGGLGDPPSTDGASWRPFQIAFILTNLRGLADAEHPDREIADLLWFPTGGGKTEAYLGHHRHRDPPAAAARPAGRPASRCSCATRCGCSPSSSTSAPPGSSAPSRSSARPTSPTRRRSRSASGSARARPPTTSTTARRALQQGAQAGRPGHRRRRQRPGPAAAVPLVRHRARPRQLRDRRPDVDAGRLRQRHVRLPQRSARPHHRRATSTPTARRS